MADRTLGFKVTDEVHERARTLIEASGLSSKEWLEHALAMYEVKALQANTPDYAKDLTELELHTTRIYELVVNMIQQSLYLKDHAVKDVSDKLESKEGIITELQAKLAETKEQVNQSTTENKQFAEQQIVLQKQLDEQKSTIDNSNLLISEYKEKNDTLSGLVTKYQGYAAENELLKEELANTKAELTNRTHQAEQERDQLHTKLQLSQEQLNQAHTQHKAALETLTEKKDIEREKALIALERTNQEQLTAANEKIRSLYDEIAELRLTHEQQTQELKQDFESQLNDLKK